MKRISRYILRLAIAPFIFGVSTVVFLFLMQFLMKTLDKLIGKGLEDIIILQLIIYNIAWMLVLAVPMGVLFASLVAFGNMSASHEVTIIKASGGSLIKMMQPLIIAGAILFGIMFVYNDDIMPETNHRAKILMYDIQRKKPTLAIEAGQFSNDIDGFTILAKQVDTATSDLHSVTIYDQRQANLRRTISSEICNIKFSEDFKKLIFNFKNGEIHQSKLNDVNNYRIIKFSDYSILTSAYGFGFEQSEKGMLSRGDREMRISDMQAIVDEVKEKQNISNKNLEQILQNQLNYLLMGVISNSDTLAGTLRDTEITNIENVRVATIGTIGNIGINNQRVANRSRNPVAEFSYSLVNTANEIASQQERIDSYEVEIYKKYAMPFACFVFVFVGCPLGIITRGGNFGLSASITLGFFILYWACLIGGEKFADRGFASPMLSMWLGNIIIGTAGIILTWKTNRK